MPLNQAQLVSDIQVAARGVLQRDLAGISGFKAAGLKRLAVQAQVVADGIAAGTISELNRPFFINDLKNRTRNFVHTLIGLFEITVDKLIDAIVRVLVSAIGAAVGFPI